MGLLDPPGLSKTQARALFLSRARSLATAFRNPSDPLPSVSTDQPTVTWGSASTLARSIPVGSPEIRILGTPGTFNTSNSQQALGGAYSGLDFFLTGQNVEIAGVEQVANTSRMWVFIDGKPMTATESLGLTTAAGGTYYLKLAFTASARRRITVHSSGLSAWTKILIDTGGAISPAPPLPKVAFLGDSFFGGSAGSSTLQSCAMDLTRLLGVNGFNAGNGGTGYVTAGATSVYGSTTRVNSIANFGPELIVVSGSVNDGSATGLQTAAASCYTALAAACPNVPVIVFGPQPSNAVDTLSAARAGTNAAVRAAALAASNVLAYCDMVGNAATGTVPPAWAGSNVYNTGDLVTYHGAIYQWQGANGGSTGSFAPGTSSAWTLQTYMYTGTGTSGATTGDGNRDTFLYSDGVHPLPPGALALSDRQAYEIRRVLLAA